MKWLVGALAAAMVMLLSFMGLAVMAGVVAAQTCEMPAANDGDFYGGVDEIDLSSFQGTKLGAALAALPKAKNSESRLQPNTVLMLRLTEKLWPYYGRSGSGTIGGYREDPYPYHPSGQALDIMMPNDARDAKGVRLGNTIAAFYKTNAAALGIDYIVWRQQIWSTARSGEGWRKMSDRGDWTSNHMNHVHLNVFGSHVPKGTLRLPPGVSAAEVQAASSVGATARTNVVNVAQRAAPAPRAASGPLTYYPVRPWMPISSHDLRVSEGVPVVAVRDGVVTTSADLKNSAGDYVSYGRVIKIKYVGAPAPMTHAHLSKRFVRAGAQVRAGQVIGLVGTTGNSSGPHLHVDFNNDPSAIDWIENQSPQFAPASPVPTDEVNDNSSDGADDLPEECQDAGAPGLPEMGGSGPYKDSLTPMRSVGTGRTPKQAAQWLMGKVNTQGYAHQCLKLADDAYLGKNRLPRAIDQWYRAKDKGFAHPLDRNPPIGAQLFWWTDNDAKHIAIYVGGGKVVTNVSAAGNVQLLPASELDSWGPYLGWAEPYYG